MFLSELTNATGAAFFVFLFIIRAVQAAGGNWIAILLALQSAVAAFLLVMHKPVERMSHPVMTLLSWLCALLPLTFNLAEADALYSLPGLLLALWALFALGFSFSIAPEDRGVVMRGPYRLVRHPMYLGELILRGPVEGLEDYAVGVGSVAGERTDDMASLGVIYIDSGGHCRTGGDRNAAAHRFGEGIEIGLDT